MLNLFGAKTIRNCDGTTRRDFLRVGSLGLGGLTLPGLLRSRAHAAAENKSTADTSVVWL